MLRDLVAKNLQRAYYIDEDGTYDLEFKVNTTIFIIKNVIAGVLYNPVGNWYWTDERIKRAIKNADPEEIEITSIYRSI